MRAKIVLVVAAVLAAACGTGAGSDDPMTRTVFVDWGHDEFASSFVGNFPAEIDALPGSTIVFKQVWTGEPHTVTGGTLVDTMMRVAEPLTKRIVAGQEVDFREFESKVFPLMEPLPYVIPEDSIAQTAGRPCYLDTGVPPADGSACPRDAKPEFTGRQAYFNSGVIPYEGPEGNTFEVKLAADIEPGDYYFYCAMHGPRQYTKVEVKPEGSTVEPQEDVNRRARAEAAHFAAPLEKAFRTVRESGRLSSNGLVAEGPFVGLSEPTWELSWINEFVPKDLKVKAGEALTFTFMAFHTLTFEPPEYFPSVQFMDDGTVRFNPALMPAAGGAAEPPAPPPMTGPPPESEGPPEILEVDGGAYDGEGFWSSGLIQIFPFVKYTMRITKPGTYRFACLLHPPMVGTVEVTP